MKRGHSEGTRGSRNSGHSEGIQAPRGAPPFFLCCRGLTVEFFATVVMFLHLGHVQAQSASVASALMTFVLGTPSSPSLVLSPGQMF